MSNQKRSAADRKKTMVRVICIVAAAILVLTTVIGAILSNVL